MKRVFSLLLLLCSVAGYAQQPAAPLLKTSYDKFHDQTTVSIRKTILIDRGTIFTPSYDFKGVSQPDKIESIRLLLIGRPNTFVPSNSLTTQMYVIIDGRQPAQTFTLDYGTTFQTQHVVSQTYALNIPVPGFRGIACAKTVEMRVGLSEGALTEADIAGLRALYIAAGGECK